MMKLAPIPIRHTRYCSVVEPRVRMVLDNAIAGNVFANPTEARYLQYIRQNLDTVLYGDPQALLKIVAWDESFRLQNGWISVCDLGKRNWRTRPNAHTQLHDFLFKAFSYLDFLRGVGGYGAHEFIQLIRNVSKLKCCPYCNAEYVYAIRSLKGKGWVNKTSLDHFLPKSKFPYLSVSVYNMIPSCTRCNSGSKSTKNVVRFVGPPNNLVARYTEVHPHLASFHRLSAFELKNYNRLLIRGILPGEFPKFNAVFAAGRNGELARASEHTFHLRDVYSAIYGDEIKAIFGACRVLKTHGYLKDRLDFAGMTKTVAKIDLKTLLLRCSLREGAINSERLSKVTIDIANQMGL